MTRFRQASKELLNVYNFSEFVFHSDKGAHQQKTAPIFHADKFIRTLLNIEENLLNYSC